MSLSAHSYIHVLYALLHSLAVLVTSFTYCGRTCSCALLSFVLKTTHLPRPNCTLLSFVVLGLVFATAEHRKSCLDIFLEQIYCCSAVVFTAECTLMSCFSFFGLKRGQACLPLCVAFFFFFSGLLDHFGVRVYLDHGIATKQTTIAIFSRLCLLKRERSGTNRIMLRQCRTSLCVVGVAVRTPMLSSLTSSSRCGSRQFSSSIFPSEVSNGGLFETPKPVATLFPSKKWVSIGGGVNLPPVRCLRVCLFFLRLLITAERRRYAKRSRCSSRNT